MSTVSFSTKQEFSHNTLPSYILKVPGSNSAGVPVILTEVFCSFPRPLTERVMRLELLTTVTREDRDTQGG
jgi:hypothetical protein